MIPADAPSAAPGSRWTRTSTPRTPSTTGPEHHPGRRLRRTPPLRSRRRLPPPSHPADAPTSAAGGVRLDSIPQAIAAIARGEAVVVVDDEDRENEGDLIFAAPARHRRS